MTKEVNQDVNKHPKKSETARVRDRVDLAIRKLHENYSYSDGWRITRINNNVIQLDVVLERSTEQSNTEQRTTVGKAEGKEVTDGVFKSELPKEVEKDSVKQVVVDTVPEVKVVENAIEDTTVPAVKKTTRKAK